MTNPYQQSLLLSGWRRVILLIALLAALALVSVAVGRTIRSRIQSASARARKDPLVAQIEKSPSFPLRIDQDDDAPLRIIEAKVKEISSADYEKLTSGKSDLTSILSAPEVSVVNVSNQTISRVMLIINDVSAQKSTGISIRNLSIPPGGLLRLRRRTL